MVEHIDFVTQKQYMTNDQSFRPDMVINLPDNKHIVVDAKSPLTSYQNHREDLKKFTEQINKHINQLSQKKYWQNVPNSPSFVILFLPFDELLGQCIQHDPTILDSSAQRKVILSSPSLLLATLKSIAYSWQQHTLNQRSDEIFELASQLYDRTLTLEHHLTDMGRALDKTNTSYHKAVSSWKSRILPVGNRIHKLAQKGKPELTNLPDVTPTTIKSLD